MINKGLPSRVLVLTPNHIAGITCWSGMWHACPWLQKVLLRTVGRDTTYLCCLAESCRFRYLEMHE